MIPSPLGEALAERGAEVMQEATSVPHHNYRTKLQQLWQTVALPRDVGVHQVSVYHDDWCGIFQARRCDWDPESQLKASLPGHNN
jgi:hypothetical protein